MEIVRESVLGVRVSAVNISQALAQFDEWLQERSLHYVCVTPAHSIMACHNNEHLRDIFNSSGMTTPDGMAVVWLMALKGHRNVKQVCGTELLLKACQHGLVGGYRHFFYGGVPEVAKNLSVELKRRFPGLEVAGVSSPPYRLLSPDEDRAIVAEINASHPDIVWVGLSSPKQEIWMHAHLAEIQAPVMVGVGAAFDFVSGAKTRAPRWIQRCGMEWLFRFALEPRRLWPRYSQYPLFVLLALADLIGIRRHHYYPE